MKYKYSKKHEQMVNDFFNSPTSIKEMKKLGSGGKIKVDWNTGFVIVQGNKSGRSISIDDILDAEYKILRAKVL